MESLRILVADNNLRNQQSAQELRSDGHDVSIVKTYGEVIAHLTPFEEVENVRKGMLWFYRNTTFVCQQQGNPEPERPKALDILDRGGSHPFDVVLTDNLLPVQFSTVMTTIENEVCRKGETAVMQPVGSLVVMKALMREVPYIALVSVEDSTSLFVEGATFEGAVNWVNHSWEGIKEIGNSRVMINNRLSMAKGNDKLFGCGKDWRNILWQLTRP